MLTFHSRLLLSLRPSSPLASTAPVRPTTTRRPSATGCSVSSESRTVSSSLARSSTRERPPLHLLLLFLIFLHGSFVFLSFLLSKPYAFQIYRRGRSERDQRTTVSFIIKLDLDYNEEGKTRKGPNLERSIEMRGVCTSSTCRVHTDRPRRLVAGLVRVQRDVRVGAFQSVADLNDSGRWRVGRHVELVVELGVERESPLGDEA